MKELMFATHVTERLAQACTALGGCATSKLCSRTRDIHLQQRSPDPGQRKVRLQLHHMGRRCHWGTRSGGTGGRNVEEPKAEHGGSVRTCFSTSADLRGEFSWESPPLF